MEKNYNQNTGPDNLWQIIGFILIAFSLILLAFLYTIYKGRIPIFNLDIPGLRTFDLSLWGAAGFLLFRGLHLVTHRKIRKIFYLLSWVCVAWFFCNFIIIDML